MTQVTRVFYASTLFGAMSLAAACDENLFGGRDERRLLLVSTNTFVPEVGGRFDDSPAFASLRHRFDDIVFWNEVIAPLHPAGWNPPAGEVPLLSRMIRRELGLQGPVHELVVESIAVAPARTIATLIDECPITVYSDGLMSYGPTRDDVPDAVGRRPSRLLYLDLVPELTPLLLREQGVSAQVIPTSAFAKVLAELPSPATDGVQGRPVIVGQYLAAIGLLTVEEEADLHANMLRALVAAGHREVVFRPHPAAGRMHVRQLEETARALGVTLTVPDDRVPAEAWFAEAQPALVVSCFSTALLTAQRFAGVPVATMGAELMLERITPYQNSNRIPATIVAAVVPRLNADGTLTDPPHVPVAELVSAVGYCMQSGRNADLRPVAEEYLRRFGPGRYFKKRRLHTLSLIDVPTRLGAPIARDVRAAAARGVVRRRAALRRRLTARRAT